MIALKPHQRGTILPVLAQPAARRNEIAGTRSGMLKVSVTQSPERGKANKALIAVMSKQLLLRKSQFELIAGETARQKRFLVKDVVPDDLSERIRGVLENKARVGRSP